MRAFLLLGALFCSLASCAQVQRPKITGIAYVRFHTTDRKGARHFYRDVLGLPCQCVDRKEDDSYVLGSSQRILIDTRSNALVGNEEEIALETSDVPAMRSYLRAHGYAETRSIGDGFSVADPEGRTISFVPRRAIDPLPVLTNAASKRIIHVGFVVNDRAAEDAFFRDLLGFKLYWTGGPNWDGGEKSASYASMQVPDGHEWVEYMLNRSPKMDAKSYGSANHVALGVPDIQAAAAQLRKNGWDGTAQPRQGQDGKWQLNLFDPDNTRAELMEFTPSREPCCTKYQQPHPAENER